MGKENTEMKMMKLGLLMLSILGKIAQLPLGKGISRFALVRKLYDFLHQYLIPKVIPKGIVLVKVQEHKMYINPQDRSNITQSLILKGVYEEQMTKLFKSLLKEGMTVVDLGANIGYYTLIAAKLVGEKGKVFAFEPEPDNYALLVKSIEENEYKNVIAVQKAVSNRAGTIKLFLNPDNKASHTIGTTVYNYQESWEHILVDVMSLDEFFENKQIPKIDIIKIDVEGAEEQAFEGMSDIIKGNKDLKIFSEFWPRGLRGFGSSPEGFLNELIEHGFKLNLIDEQNGSVYPVDVGGVLRVCQGEKWINLFCERG